LILYNVTVNINEEVNNEWFEWMKEDHIPEVMATGLFTDCRMFRLLGSEADGGITYSIQYFCESMEEYDEYQKKFAAEIQKKHNEKYKDKFAAFRTIMESVK
jgi:hypothetical protein